MLRTLVILICFVGLFQGLQAQHPPMLSQYMFNGMVINPAYTGSRDALSVTALYRHQWAGFEGAPRTQSIFLHSPLKNPKNNFGAAIIHDRLGVSNHTLAYGTYAYRIDFEEKGRLSFGLQAGVSILKDQWSQVVTDQSGDDVFAADSPTFMVPRFGTGVYYDTRKWYLGVAAPFLLDLKNSDYRLYTENSLSYRPLLISGGMLFRLNPELFLRPTFLVKYLPESPTSVDLNLNMVIKEDLWIGASYRMGDAVVALLEYQINPQFRVGYSYDYSITDLQKYNNGSHEFMIRYEFGYQLKTMSPRYF